MSEKRYEFTAFDCAYITDHQDHKDYPFVEKPEYIEEIVDLLNNQEAEIKKLKKQLQQKNTINKIEYDIREDIENNRLLFYTFVKTNPPKGYDFTVNGDAIKNGSITYEEIFIKTMDMINRLLENAKSEY